MDCWALSSDRSFGKLDLKFQDSSLPSYFFCAAPKAATPPPLPSSTSSSPLFAFLPKANCLNTTVPQQLLLTHRTDFSPLNYSLSQGRANTTVFALSLSQGNAKYNRIRIVPLSRNAEYNYIRTILLSRKDQIRLYPHYPALKECHIQLYLHYPSLKETPNTIVSALSRSQGMFFATCGEGSLAFLSYYLAWAKVLLGLLKTEVHQ